ncbi:MAG: hypothetical protein QM653_07780 [Dysgonomonas sp.]|uniref:hypothetical protein n=1 Tax=Dysgonomonas sp. TaxID=1891233 RepID=UPI0039E5EE2A
MDVFKTKLITYTVASGLLISGCIGLGLYYFFPTLIDWDWYTGIVLFFLIIETGIMLYVNSASQTKEKKQMVNVYMLTKVVKMLVSLIVIGIFAFNHKEHLKGFIAVFILFYLLYLAVETSLFVKIEKHIKEKKSKDE